MEGAGFPLLHPTYITLERYSSDDSMQGPVCLELCREEFDCKVAMPLRQLFSGGQVPALSQGREIERHPMPIAREQVISWGSRGEVDDACLVLYVSPACLVQMSYHLRPGAEMVSLSLKQCA